MADGRKTNGGHSTKGVAGRKSRVDERDLFKKLGKYSEEGIKILIESMRDKEPWAVKMFFEYYYGKPKETKDIHIKEYPQIEINHIGDYTSIPEAITVDE